MNPVALSILVHSYFMSEPHQIVFSESGKNAVEFLIREGLIKPKEGLDREYSCTSRGSAHISQLLDLKLPQLVWLDKDGKFIV